MSLTEKKEGLSEITSEINRLKAACDQMSDYYLTHMIDFLINNSDCPKILIPMLMGQVNQIIAGIAINLMPNYLTASEQKVIDYINDNNHEIIRVIKEGFKQQRESVRH